MRIPRFLAALCLFLMAAPAFGQAVVLRPEEVLPQLKEASPDAFYINGPNVYGMTDEIAEAYYPLGDSAKYILALITLRLADKGVIDLDASVAKALPDLLEFNPFEVAITPKHLLAETAGFAKPPQSLGEAAKDAPLAYFLIKDRGAGQISVKDAVGWQLLADLLERQSGQSLADLVLGEILNPLGIPESAVLMHDPETNWQVPLSKSSLSGASIAPLLGVLLSNRDNADGPYLKDETYALLFAKPLWQFHPLGEQAVAGLIRRIDDMHAVLGPRSLLRGIGFRALPDAGVIFVNPGRGVSHIGFSSAVKALRQRLIPTQVDREALVAQAGKLVRPTELGTRFQCAEVPAALSERIANTKACTMKLRLDAQGTLQVWRQEYDFSQTLTMKETAPLYYEEDRKRFPVIISPFKAGGYAAYGPRYYVRTDSLGGFQARIGKYIPLMVILLLTGAIHIRSKTSHQWRRFGWFCLVGAALVSFGLYADWFWWPTVLYEMQMPWLIVLWRSGLNIGLMLLLALPMLALTFVRQQNMPDRGIALLFAGPHLGLVSIAALGLFLTTIIWGVAGAFSAY